jgi:predicted small metal-binding protein
MMRVIECNECGETLSAANDEELADELIRHMKEEHPDVEIDSDRAAELVGENAYTATDS